MTDISSNLQRSTGSALARLVFRAFLPSVLLQAVGIGLAAWLFSLAPDGDTACDDVCFPVTSWAAVVVGLATAAVALALNITRLIRGVAQLGLRPRMQYLVLAVLLIPGQLLAGLFLAEWTSMGLLPVSAFVAVVTDGVLLATAALYGRRTALSSAPIK